MPDEPDEESLASCELTKFSVVHDTFLTYTRIPSIHLGDMLFVAAARFADRYPDSAQLVETRATMSLLSMQSAARRTMRSERRSHVE